jgi:hypothetical protein
MSQGIASTPSSPPPRPSPAQVESGMVDSVHAVIAQGIAAYPATPRHEWVLRWPGQVVLAVTAIFWTQVRRHGRGVNAGDISGM